MVVSRRVELCQSGEGGPLGVMAHSLCTYVKRLLAFDYPVDNELLELPSIEAFDQSIGQRLVLRIGTFEAHEVRNRGKHPLASLLL